MDRHWPWSRPPRRGRIKDSSTLVAPFGAASGVGTVGRSDTTMDIEFRDQLEPDGPTVEEEYRRFSSSADQFEAAFGRMMLELLDALRSAVVGPRLIAEKGLMWFESPELRLSYSDGRGHGTTIQAKVDYKDRSPLADGLPLLHYRLNRRPWPKQRLNSGGELRTRDVNTACEFILEAIRECRGTG